MEADMDKSATEWNKRAYPRCSRGQGLALTAPVRQPATAVQHGLSEGPGQPSREMTSSAPAGPGLDTRILRLTGYLEKEYPSTRLRVEDSRSMSSHFPSYILYDIEGSVI